MKADPWMGGVWLATDGGLFFKDLQAGGMRLYSVSNGLPSAVIEDIAVGETHVWVGTLAGVAVLDKATQNARTLKALDGSEYTYPTRTVFLDRTEAWLGTDSFGLFRADPRTLVVTAVPNPVDGEPFDDPIYGLGAVGSELYISAYGYGLVRWDRTTGQASTYDYSYNFPDKPPYLRLATSAEAVWVGTDGDGVIRVARKTGALTEFAGPETSNARTVLAPTVVGDTVWMATTSGATRYERVTDTWTSWNYVPADDAGDSANSIALVDGQIYAATASGDIARFDVATQTWPRVSWWDSGRVPQHNHFLACQVDGERLLFGTGGGGANFYDPATGVWSRAGDEPGDQGKVRDILVWRTASDADTRYFVHANGVTEMDTASGQYLNYYTDGRVGAGRGANMVRDVALDGDHAWFANHASKPHTREGTLWNHGGVTRMDRQTHEMTFYGKSAGLSDENLTRVVPDGSRVWLGMENGGLDVLDKTTGTIRNVYTGQGLVNDILVRPDGVWVAAGRDGILRVDPTTLLVTLVPALDGNAAWSLLDQGHTIWVGSVYKGIYALDPTTLRTTHYGNGRNVDYLANCMIEHDGRLYLGTPWGVERFDLATRQFLPQVGRLPAERLAAAGQQGPGGAIVVSDPGSPTHAVAPAMLSIDEPLPDSSIEPGSKVIFGGEATGPASARVTVRVDDGPWLAADGFEHWNAQLTIPDLVGPVTLSARIELEGQPLAQASRTVYAGLEASQADGHFEQTMKLGHEPILHADVSEPLLFQLDGAQGLPDSSAVLELRRPGSVHFESIPMVAYPSGVLVAEVQPLGVAGHAEYRIVARWTDGGARLPAPFTGYGEAYPLIVEALGGGVQPLVSASTFKLVAGEPARVDVMVQNPGVRPAIFYVSIAGVPAEWVSSVPGTVEVGPSSSQLLSFQVAVPAGQKEGRYELGLTLTPAAAGMPATQAPLEFVVGDPGPEKGASKLTPLPAWPSLLALLAMALAFRRR